MWKINVLLYHSPMFMYNRAVQRSNSIILRWLGSCRVGVTDASLFWSESITMAPNNIHKVDPKSHLRSEQNNILSQNKIHLRQRIGGFVLTLAR